jgi:pimeloyl-ACP methyl ester carboxylesterase
MKFPTLCQKKREKKVLELTTSSFVIDDSVLEKRDFAYRKHPARRVNFIRQLIAAFRFRPVIKEVKSPILLLNSLGDRLVDSGCSQKIQAKWKWELKTHPTANHDLPLDDPEWVLNEIRRWLKTI